METFITIPYERRVLLLPQCLRRRDVCPAVMDEFGLVCLECGNCPLGSLQAEAEELGYVVLIAEGTTVVTRLLARGKVDAVIGVSCLDALERSFPSMAAHAIPGIAAPLLTNGCDQTLADLKWIRETIHLHSPGKWSGLQELDNLRAEVESWFRSETLETIAPGGKTATGRISAEWLTKGGKRWRPFLSVCVYTALRGMDAEIPPGMKKLAVAVECFHKASLVHDDIEDGDAVRYGEMTLHARYGTPIALNAGDLLIGEGYRLIADAGGSPEQTVRMLSVAAEGHRMLCLGQGEELFWMRRPEPLSSAGVLENFRRKTAPAFEVALQIGAICAGADDSVRRVLTAFSESLGIAYQIRDDIEDHRSEYTAKAGTPSGLSLLTALAYEHSPDERKQEILALYGSENAPGRTEKIREIIGAAQVEEKASQLFEHYRNESVRSLSPLQNARLKGLLRRIVTRILDGE